MVLFDGIPESTDKNKDQTLKSTKTVATRKSGSTSSSTKSSHSGKSTSTTESHVDEHSKGVRLGKLAFVAILMVVAAFLGFISYYLLERAEQNLWEEQYESMTERAIETIQLVSVSISNCSLPSCVLNYVLFGLLSKTIPSNRA